jgi:hypothetical protein
MISFSPLAVACVVGAAVVGAPVVGAPVVGAAAVVESPDSEPHAASANVDATVTITSRIMSLFITVLLPIVISRTEHALH